LDKHKIGVVKDELYDPLIEFFLASGSTFLEVDVNGINSSCLRNHLNRSIEKKGLKEKVRTVIRKNLVYLVLELPDNEGELIILRAHKKT